MKGAVAAVAAVAALLPFAAQAQSWFTPGPTSSGFYIGVESGVSWMLNNGGYQMNTGWTTGGIIGYDFLGGIRAEFEGSYRSNTGTGPGRVPGVVSSTPATTTPPTVIPPERIPPVTTCVPQTSGPPICTTTPGRTIPGRTIPGITTPGTTTLGTVPGTVSGEVQQMVYMVNGYVDLLPGAIIVPYIGAGAGLAFISQDISGCGLCSTQFAYQGTVGVGWNVTETIRVDVETRYYGTTGPGTYSNNNITSMVKVKYKLNQRRDDSQRQQQEQSGVAPSSLMVFFDWDRSDLTPQAQGTIQQAANLYRSNGNARITATGHTDTSGPETYNMALSLRRANAVKDQLVRDGVPAQAIVVVGKGESKLLAPTADGVREAQNRRVEIVIQ